MPRRVNSCDVVGNVVVGRWRRDRRHHQHRRRWGINVDGSATVLAGVPGNSANGSNRLGILTSTASATVAFRRLGVDGLSKAIPVLAPTLVGSLIGSLTISRLPDRAFEIVFGVLMIPLIVLTVRKPTACDDVEPWPTWLTVVIFGLIGAFGGVSGRYRSGVTRSSHSSRVRSCDGEQREDGGVVNGDRHRPSSVFVVGKYRVAPSHCSRRRVLCWRLVWGSGCGQRWREIDPDCDGDRCDRVVGAPHWALLSSVHFSDGLHLPPM